MTARDPGAVVAWLACALAGVLVVGMLVLTAPEGAGSPAPAPAAVAEPTPPALLPAPAAAPTPDPSPTAEPAPDADVAVFAGLSTWIDLYDVAWTPQEQVEAAAAGGVEVIFAQAGRFSSPRDVHDAERLGALLEAAHDAGLRVVTWYIPDFTDPQRALARSLAAARFTSPRGDRPDGFGLDIERDDVADVALRTSRLLELSAALREELGATLPLAAIVLPPLQLELNTTWWPDFPYAELRAHYDVFVPMSYSSFHGTDAATTRTWALENVERLRALAGDPDLPVHLAGGIADDLPELAAFVAGAQAGDVVGAGLYDLHTTPPAAWPVLQPLRSEG